MRNSSASTTFLPRKSISGDNSIGNSYSTAINGNYYTQEFGNIITLDTMPISTSYTLTSANAMQ